MNMLKAGVRLKSAVCDAEVMVIKIPHGKHRLNCGGQPMIALTTTRDPALALTAAQDQACLVGKRYVDAQQAIELLCTKGGKGHLTADDATLVIKQAKALPSSD